jgi:hypothetical protein
MSDKEAFNEFCRGATFVLAMMAAVALVFGVLATREENPPVKFVVVDKYEGCDVVRYTDSSNGWNYLLHCKQ